MIGYLAEYVSTSGGHYGGLLVVNEKGLPREFRHTDGIRPTRLQQILYGDTLDSCLGTDSMGPALLAALQKRPSILLVDEKSRLIFGEFVLAHRPAALIVCGPSLDLLTFMNQIAPSGDLVDAVPLTHKGVTNSHIVAYVDEGDEGGGRAALLLAQGLMNLRSPFDRIRSVLAQVAEIEEGKGKK
ncbi:MAG: hypothetical protein P4L46_12885 [Fimbriimonas sp.]|nr:hypothetical protein [Fimbriimonas sp.]